MINKKDILKMTKHVFRKTQGYPDRRIMHPHREWGIGIFVFAVLIISGGIFAGNIFVSYLDVATVAGDSGNAIPRYRETFARDAIDLYTAKEENYANLQKEKNTEQEVVSGATRLEDVPAQNNVDTSPLNDTSTPVITSG